MKTLALRFLAIGLLAAYGVDDTVAQQATPGTRTSPTSRSTHRRTYLSLGAGYSFIYSHEGIDEFWNGKIAGSVAFTVNIANGVNLGVGVDAARIKFDRRAFYERFPTIPGQARDILMLNVYLAWRYTPFARYRTAPFIGVDVGASHTTPATYKEVIGGVRHVYYDIPAKTRLILSPVAGLTIYPVSWFAFEFQGKAVLHVNDPDFGLTVLALGGLRIRL